MIWVASAEDIFNLLDIYDDCDHTSMIVNNL